MISLKETEKIRKAYFIQEKSIREIAREYHHGRRTIRNAITSAASPTYTQKKTRAAPVLEAYKERIQELVEESLRQPPKQRYTARKIYQIIQSEGYQGSESTVRRYVGACRQKRNKVYLPLQFNPGEDAQVDWGEAQVNIGGIQQKGHLFIMRLNYSKARFLAVYPFEKQEAFLDGHIRAFDFFGGVPHTITYDNLKTAVFRVLAGKNRHEQDSFTEFRSHYLFESRYCNVRQPHEKGGVENDVGYMRRNYLTPIPKVDRWQTLNQKLWLDCQQDTHRRIRGNKESIAVMLQEEQPCLLPLPNRHTKACAVRPVKTNPYSQITYETNRYSVPVEYAGKQLVLRAYPFEIEVLFLDHVVARHERCFERETDCYEPLHYLPLLIQRPGAFDHAAPIRHWRKSWPPIYEQLLTQLCDRFPRSQAIRKFLMILNLNRNHPKELVERAIQVAMQYGVPSVDAVKLQLRSLTVSEPVFQQLDLTNHGRLANLGDYTVNIGQYDTLVKQPLEVLHE